MAPLIKDLQGIKREARQIVRPECSNYLNDLVVFAMESEINSQLSFLAQESDTIVAKKMEESASAREIVDQEIERFKEDPLKAYQLSTITVSSLEESVGQALPFSVPEGWVDIAFADDQDIKLSIPSGWERTTFGEKNEYTKLQNPDKSLELWVDVFDQPNLTGYDTDSARLFTLKTDLETDEHDFYLEHSSEVGVYAENKGYVVENSSRDKPEDDIVEQIWAVIVTPENKEILIIANTTREEFAEIDHLTLGMIFSSIRSK